MRNIKHTIIAIAAIAMVGTLSFFQVSDMSAKKHERDMRLGSSNQAENITIASTESEDGAVAVAKTNSEEDVQATEQAEDTQDNHAIAEKSYLTLGYANVTGSVEIKSDPSDESQTVGTMNGAEQVEILESTDGWYKVMDNGKAGYVETTYVTLDKTEAAVAAYAYDNYKKAIVATTAGLTVRANNSEESDSVGSVGNGESVIVVGTDGDYTKVIYGADYNEGYVLNDGIELTGEWIGKQDVSAEKQRIADEKAEAARQAEIAKNLASKSQSVLANRPVSNSQQTVTNTEATATPAATETATPKESTTQSSTGGSAIVETAMKYLGVPYVWGGTTPSGFDCSGLVQYSCRANGISVPRVAADQREAGKYVSRENLQPGDLVFFGSGSSVTHVGIYVGNGNMIHAPQTGDVVKISTINSDYRISHYAGAVRVW